MTPYYQDESVCIYHGDCLEVFAAGVLPKMDHAIFDPPYSEWVHDKSRMGAKRSVGDKENRFADGGFSRQKDIGFAALDEDTREKVAAWIGGHVSRWSLAFCDVESSHLWRDAFVDFGLDYVRTGAWVKVGGTPQFTGDRPAAGFEAITIAHAKGRKRWNGGGAHAVWTVPIVRVERVHTTQKPEELMAQLLAQFTDPGDAIIDPFMGSGTTLVAAKRLGRKAIGIERERKYCDLAIERLAQGALGLEMTHEAVGDTHAMGSHR